MSYVNKETPHPPAAPEIERKIAFYPAQAAWFGFTLIIIILALLGVFGETFASTNATGDTVEMEVEYPARFRYKMTNPITVTITNTSGSAIDRLTVDFERDYIDQFSEVTFMPDVQTVTGEAYQVELTDFQPGEERVITVDLQGEHYWRHEGTIAASIMGERLVEVEISTLVLP